MIISCLLFLASSVIFMRQSGQLLSVMVPVQGDPTREWLERRSVDSFMSKWEEEGKKDGGESPSDEGEDDDDDDDLPTPKRQKITANEGLVRKLLKNVVVLHLFIILKVF